MTELQKRLIEAGYSKDEMFHHYSDLYVFVTPVTKAVIDKWCKDTGYKKHLFISTFNDNITGKLMYECYFQYAE